MPFGSLLSNRAVNMFAGSGFRGRAAMRVGGAALAGAIAGHNTGDGHAVAGGLIGGLAGAGGHVATGGFSSKIHLARAASARGYKLGSVATKLPYLF